MVFKNKYCSNCSTVFSPNSGIQKFCKSCISICLSCKSPLNPFPRLRYGCVHCSFKKRRFTLKCNTCLNDFKAKNQFQKNCYTCLPKIKLCLDCNKQLSSNKKTRCNSCRAKNTLKTKGLNPLFAKKIYEYKSNKYRSTWEVMLAERLDVLDIKFEYEKRYEQTGGFPDFYLPELDFYVEIHPDYFGTKSNLPKNCILLKSKEEIDTLFILLYNLCYGKSVCLYKEFDLHQLTKLLNSSEILKERIKSCL